MKQSEIDRLEDQYPEEGEYYPVASSLMSTCCGAPPYGPTEMGICSRCHEHTEFEQETDDE